MQLCKMVLKKPPINLGQPIILTTFVTHSKLTLELKFSGKTFVLF